MKFFDPDFRKTPKTSVFCAACQKDIKGARYAARVIDDCTVAMADEAVGEVQRDEIRDFGPDCAKRIGLEYFTKSK
jgi:hypothetical protein